LSEVNERAEPVKREFLVLMNAHHEAIPFVLPALPQGSSWLALVDTSCEPTGNPECLHDAEATYSLEARSLVVLVARVPGQVRFMERRHEA